MFGCLLFLLFLCELLLLGGAIVTTVRASPLVVSAPSSPVVAPHLLLSLELYLLSMEKLLLKFCNILEKHITHCKVDFTLVCEVIFKAWQAVLVHHKDCIQSSLSYLERGQVRQEIVTDKKAQENPVINKSLKVKSEWHLVP